MRSPLRRVAAFPLAVAVMCAAVGSAGAADPVPPPPNPTPIWFEPPLPPQLAPDLFLVTNLTPANRWPRPWPPFDPRRPSGYIPPPCEKLAQDPSGRVLDCWLMHQPVIADAIQWELTPGRVSRWLIWGEAEKAALRSAFVTARHWRSDGFGAWPGDPWIEPPENQERPYLGEDEIRTVLDSEGQAWREFVAQVAVSLAGEIDAWVPWSLRDYDRAALEEIFSGVWYRYLLDRDDGGPNDSVYPGHIVERITPAHPATILNFLLDEGILAATPRATIGRLLDWSRDHMRHQFITGLPVGRDLFAFWQYRGLPPVARIIEGTEVFDPERGVLASGIHSWTTGCTTTTRFWRAVLRVVNIPVTEVISRQTCSHTMPYFAGEGLYLTHGDDPYGRYFVTGDFRGEELLVPSATWSRWFPLGDEATGCRNVGRRVVDLNVERPSAELVRLHCLDLLAGVSHADSEVLRSVHGVYTAAELSALGLWDRLDALAGVSPVGECVSWRARDLGGQRRWRLNGRSRLVLVLCSYRDLTVGRPVLEHSLQRAAIGLVRSRLSLTSRRRSLSASSLSAGRARGGTPRPAPSAHRGAP